MKRDLTVYVSGLYSGTNPQPAIGIARSVRQGFPNANIVGVEYSNAAAEIISSLDSHAGALFSSSYEFPGRYARWDIGFVNPPVRISSRDRQVTTPSPYPPAVPHATLSRASPGILATRRMHLSCRGGVARLAGPFLWPSLLRLQLHPLHSTSWWSSRGTRISPRASFTS